MDELTAAASHVFTYPASSEDRRHGPTGYRDPSSYKPWLRDEFTFRCIYCLTREVWRPDGHDSFSIEHVAARSTNPESIGEYDNLVYTCLACNSRRQHLPLPFHPSEENLASHLRVNQHGQVESLSKSGERLIELCRLNRSTLVRFRQRVLHLIDVLSKSDHPDATDAMGQLLAWPEDMPDLAACERSSREFTALATENHWFIPKRWPRSLAHWSGKSLTLASRSFCREGIIHFRIKDTSPVPSPSCFSVSLPTVSPYWLPWPVADRLNPSPGRGIS